MIVQGKGFWGWVRSALPDLEAMSDGVYEGELEDHRFFVAPFTHPAARGKSNWGLNATRPYLLNTIVPAIRRILQEVDA